ncbi:MAG: WG repeat-containing protein [Lewinellaceae bacterium]|nr:WG repeat-containing protein [Lewinellaceae bacterium]
MGFINERGEEVVPPRYEYVQDYLETDSCAFILKVEILSTLWITSISGCSTTE